MEFLIYLCIILWIYFLPSLIGASRHKKNNGMVIVTNLFFGWTILGWIIALIMAFGETEGK